MRKAAKAIVLALFAVFVGARSTPARDLTFEQRVEAQRAIEQVYWNHRIWPKDNPGPKPPLSDVLPEDALRAKVEDYLKKSNALERLWQRPLTAGQLQAELNRMAASTRDPQMLTELFTALRNDPFLIAETLARPNLADPTIRAAYENDARFHGELRKKAEAAAAACRSVECMKEMGGTYGERTWRLQHGGAIVDGGLRRDRIVKLDDADWTKLEGRLSVTFGTPVHAAPTRTVSRLEETAEAFLVTAILARGPDEITTATVVWSKPPFEDWWSGIRPTVGSQISAVTDSLTVSEVTTSTCTNDSWLQIPESDLAGRTYNSAVWTGAEMIVWGGWRYCTSDDCSYLRSGGRYSPSTDSWSQTLIGAYTPSQRRYHTAVWTGTEMIVWGGEYADNALGTGARYNPASNTWASTFYGLPSMGPPARWAHSAVWTGREMIIWGGAAPDYANGRWNLFTTGNRYDPYRDIWRATSEAPHYQDAQRGWHTAVWTGTEMIIWGGGYPFFTGGGWADRNSGYRYNPDTDTYVDVFKDTRIAPRHFHNAVWTGSEMIVWGGAQGVTPLNSGGRYNPATDAWNQTKQLDGVPSPRFGQTAVWTGSEMIVWGGDDGTGPPYLNNGARYSPSSIPYLEYWTTMSTPALAARAFHAAVWTGSKMLVSGGQGATPDMTWHDGGQYCACPDGLLVYPDADGDGYGDPAMSKPACYGTIPSGYVADHSDCDDHDPAVHPGVADTTCDFIDNDCNGQRDEGHPVCGCAVQSRNLLYGWWPGDGNANDISGIGNDGTMMNGATFRSGQVGDAFHFDGYNDYVAIPGSATWYGFIERTGVFTIHAWINLSDPEARTQQAITANTSSSAERGHFFIWENSDGKQRLRLALMNGVAGVPVIDSYSPDSVIFYEPYVEWHHVAAVGDGVHVTFYVDGVGYPGSGTMGTMTYGSSTRDMNIGNCPYTSPNCQFSGEIDEVQIFFRALTASEIRALYTAEGACKCTDADGDGYGNVGGVTCYAGTQQDCNDADPNVHPGAPGFCQNCLPDGTVCDDGAACTQGDSCRSGNCFAPVTFAQTAWSPFPAGNEPNWMVSGDWNLDGHLDVAKVGGNLTVLLGDGTGHFTSTTTSINAGSYPTHITTADFNRDGKPDLAMGSGSPNSLTVALGDGLGGFTRVLYDSRYGGRYIAVGDFNGDGNADLAVTIYGSGYTSRATVLLGNGTGGFAWGAFIPGAGGRAVVAGDWNRDGRLDLALTTYDTKKVEIWLGDGTGRSFTQPPGSPVGSTGSSPDVIDAGDANRDGNLDLIVDDGSVIKVLLGDGTGGFTPVSSIFSGGYSALGFAIGDVNGDDRIDFVTTNSTNNSLQVGLGTGQGWFTLAANSPFPAGTSPRPVVVGDWNEDGKLDLFVGNSFTTATVLLNGTAASGDGTACSDGNDCTVDDVCTGLVCEGTSIAPAEVDNGVRIVRSGGSHWVNWSLATNATSSSLLRGGIDELPVGPGGADETCLATDVPATTLTWEIPENPAAGAGYWYLIRGDNACGPGPYGYQGVHGHDAVPRVSATCP